MKNLIISSSLIALTSMTSAYAQSAPIEVSDEALDVTSNIACESSVTSDKIQELVPENKSLEIRTEIQVQPKPIAKELTSTERLKIYRGKLEDRNRVMLERKIEQIRLQQELALARKLEQSMNQTFSALDHF